MSRIILALLTASTLTAAAPRDSFLFVANGHTITNGAPVNVKASKAKHPGSFFWFSIDGKNYITRDASVLNRIEEIYEPLFSPSGDFSAGEQVELLTQQLRLAKEQLRIGLEPRSGEDASIAARRVELKYEQNRLAERQNELAERANLAAEKANDFSFKVDDLNRRIEHQLHDLAAQLVGQGVAVEVKK